MRKYAEKKEYLVRWEYIGYMGIEDGTLKVKSTTHAGAEKKFYKHNKMFNGKTGYVVNGIEVAE